MSSEVMIREATSVEVVSGQSPYAVAVNVGEVSQAQEPILAWCRSQIAALEAEQREAEENLAHATKMKVKSAPFRTAARRH